MIIAIDGPAGAGKSTVAQEVARALGLAFLDTGAMYRAVTLVVLERGIHPSDGEACAAVARELVLDFDSSGRIRIDGEQGEPDIRSRTVTLNVSAVSAHEGVREAVVAVQRAIASSHAAGVVAEGRDTTTIVFPEADHKFFLQASVEERARRRGLQEGGEDLSEIRADIERRDRLDTTRAHSPLVKAPDAVEIDAGERTAAEVVSEILELVRAPRR
jgi:cytidylate kinase